MINEHDEYEIAKRMMGTIRAANSRKPINENIGSENTNNNSVDENGVIELTGEERKAQERTFRETVDKSARFDVFNIYPKANNVVFGGVIERMGGLEFQFTLEDENGLYITANNIQITDDVVRKIAKMKGYYDTWSDEWAEKLNTEYNI
jgi:hypothetical protein